MTTHLIKNSTLCHVLNSTLNYMHDHSQARSDPKQFCIENILQVSLYTTFQATKRTKIEIKFVTG